MLAIHQNGTRITSRKTAMPAHVRAFNRSTSGLKWGGAAPLLPHTPPPHWPSRSIRSSWVVVVPRGWLFLVPQEVAADQDDAEHQDRHHEEADGDPAAPPELVERDLVGVGREDLGRAARAAAGHHVDD